MVIISHKLVRNILILFTVISVLLLFGCDVAYNRAPYVYPGTTWICEEPHIELAIGEQNGTNRCFIEENGKWCEVYCYWQGGVMLCSGKDSSNDADTLFTLHCTYSKRKMTAEIGRDNMFDGKYKRLVFIRYDGVDLSKYQ